MPSNIAFQLPVGEASSDTRLLEQLCPTKSKHLLLGRSGEHSPHEEKQAVDSTDFSRLDVSSLSAAQMIDFGIASSRSAH